VTEEEVVLAALIAITTTGGEIVDNKVPHAGPTVSIIRQN